MNCIVVDDEEMSRSTVEHFVKNTDKLTLKGVFENAIDAISFLTSNSVDLIFLDIEMPEMSGLSMLDNLHESPKIIFITSKKDYAVEAFNYNVVDYLVKPVEYPRFLKAVHKAFSQIPDTVADSEVTDGEIFIKTDLKFVKIKFDEILFVEAMADYVVIHIKGKKYIIHSTMKALDNKLVQSNFIRVHRSYIVNFSKVEVVENSVIVINGETIPIGASYKNDFMKKINLL